jgi:hypothetical protein
VSATEEATDLYLRRELPDGALIEFEERLTGFRAYWYTGPTPGAKRERLPSVTTILGEIMPSAWCATANAAMPVGSTCAAACTG